MSTDQVQTTEISRGMLNDMVISILSATNYIKDDEDVVSLSFDNSDPNSANLPLTFKVKKRLH